MVRGKTAGKPDWIKARLPGGANYAEIKGLVLDGGLHTVCQSARCPNIGECWEKRTATFMILGDVCTRDCGFCAVKTGRPAPVDRHEPERVADAVHELGLRYAVVTSVTRDDLTLGGADIFAETIRVLRRSVPGCRIEVLIPDFNGSEGALNIILEAAPDVLNHNVETVPGLYPAVRPQADFGRSVELLARARRSGAVTKSGLMVGLGEDMGEVLDVMGELRRADCQILTLGQYLRPTLNHLPVVRFVEPWEFDRVKEEGLRMGFSHVESGPMVRSSYHAADQAAGQAAERVGDWAAECEPGQSAERAGGHVREGVEAQATGRARRHTAEGGEDWARVGVGDRAAQGAESDATSVAARQREANRETAARERSND